MIRTCPEFNRPFRTATFHRTAKVLVADMGQLYFDVPESADDFVSNSLWQDAYVCGIEGVPWQSRNQLVDSRLSIGRSIDSSGKLFLACQIPELGMRTLSTCSLRVSDVPYQLALELARGSCYRVRIQSDAWERAGLVLTDEFWELMESGTSQFLDAIQNRGNPDLSAASAIKSIATLEHAVIELGESFAKQSIAFRKQREPQIGTLLAGTVVPPSPTTGGEEDAFREAFNAAAVRLNWAEIETDAGRYDYDNATATMDWCTKHGVRVIGGPLVDFRSRLMPHWLYLLEDNFESFLSAATNYVEKTVTKFRGAVHLWNCAAGLNTPGPLKLNDEQAMRLAIGILQTVRRADPGTPAIVTFDQPFGEYLSKHRDALSPIHFADAIARSGLGMAGIGLDVKFGYTEACTQPRSGVDFGNMIDRWATLGLPLLVQLGVPAGSGIDPNALAPSETYVTATNAVDAANQQLRDAGPLIRTLLAKHVVHGIVWNGWSDAEQHVDSHSGVLDLAGRPRPILDYMTRLRKEFLL